MTRNGQMLGLRTQVSGIGPDIEQRAAPGPCSLQKPVRGTPLPDLQQLRPEYILQHLGNNPKLQIHQPLPQRAIEPGFEISV